MSSPGQPAPAPQPVGHDTVEDPSPPGFDERTSEPPALGEVIAGRYELLQVLGRGAFGVVYKAYDREMRETLALKFLGSASAEQKEELRREVRMARSVSHPGVVRIFDLVVDGDRTALSMELVEGPTLETLLDQAEGRLDTASIVALAHDLAVALLAIHEAGLVHRDLKPSNVMFRKGAPVIMDFGISSPRAPKAGTPAPGPPGRGRLQGTPLYMAPEHLDGRELTAATDLYALALVLYECAAGRLPGGADLGVDLAALWQIRMRPAPPLPPEATALPGPLQGAIQQCLAPEPEQRFPSAEAFLRAWDGTGPSLRPRHARKNRWALAVLGALACGLLALGVAGARRAELRASWAVPTHAPRATPKGGDEPPASFPILRDTARPSVLFVGLTAGSDTDPRLAGALTELLQASLESVPTVLPVPREQAARLRDDLGIATAREIDVAAALRHTSAQLVLVGDVTTEGEAVSLHLLARTASDATPRADVVLRASRDAILGAAPQAMADVRRALRWPSATAADATAARAALPSSLGATLKFADALAKSRHHEDDAARRLVEEVLAEDPQHGPSHALLARLLQITGEAKRARAHWATAERNATDVTGERRATLAAERWLSEGRPDEAVRSYRAVVEADPASIPKRLYLARLLLAAGHADEALAELRNAPLARSNAAGLTALRLGEAQAYEALGRFEGAASLANEAIALAEARGARGDGVEARLLLARALAAAGLCGDAGAALTEAAREDARIATATRSALASHTCPGL